MTIFVYTVTEYGCNSSHSAMWPQSVRIFTTYSAAYDYYVSVAPSLSNFAKTVCSGVFDL